MANCMISVVIWRSKVYLENVDDNVIWKIGVYINRVDNGEKWQGKTYETQSQKKDHHPVPPV